MARTAGPGGGERSILALLDDLEQQAQGAALLERDLEVEDRARAEFARVSFGSRVHALDGRWVRLRLLGGLHLEGAVLRTGDGWLLLGEQTGREWVVRSGALAAVHGAPARAVAEEALGVVRRLSLTSVLRGLAAEDGECLLHLVDGARLEGALRRVGADFVEARLLPQPADGHDLVPFTALAAVQQRR
ncbi:hypothetical protein GCM10011519_33130 [Marmoricola endophyticus]|uniref:Uncharacterized protein n=1 Tax=Marmoricola endophyticus TaxID=2040280 RepID=A0A917FA12_9ACTN|nr:hypothetical protein [Marmoricola endophyticus]GGF56609.1 hypothetical protein GCM10011519_33130 [Marmoricola endophyticus]